MKLVAIRNITLRSIVSMVLVHGVHAADNTGAKLLTPANHARVEKASEVTGKVLTRGWPVVLVRADEPECLWWAQDWARITSPGHFKTAARFGNRKTEAGAKFRLVVLMAPSVEVAKKFEPGKSFKELPDDLQRSDEVQVSLAPDPTEVVPGVIDSPAAASYVGRIGYVSGTARKGTRPTVMVSTEDSHWWVQEKSEIRDDGSFVARTRYGNDKTPTGTPFRVVVIMPTAKDAAAFSPGTSIRDLPRDIPRSAALHVVRDDSRATTEEATPVSTLAVGD